MKNNRVNTSVIVPVYNQEKYIERCIRSLLNQKLNRNSYEIIVIDDGSTDASLKIIKKYNDNIKILKNDKNMGLPFSLNKGIKESNANYVVRVDADDYVSDYFLEILTIYLDMNKTIDAVACDYLLVDEREEIIKRENSHIKPIACGIMFRKDQLTEIGLYDEEFLLFEEVEMRLRFDKKFSITPIPLPLYRYRDHNNNMTKNEEMREYFSKMINLKHGVENKDKWQK